MADTARACPQGAPQCRMATPNYYRQQAQAYAQATQGVDMAALYTRFTPHLPPGGRVLDAGCGSGRDARAFAAMGYQVAAFDASPELAAIASAHSGLAVQVADFLTLPTPDTPFDGIWACASLLHVPQAEQPQAWARLWQALRPGGVVYASYKLGDDALPAERMDELGRAFTDGTPERLARWVRGLADLARVDTWVTGDQGERAGVMWLNVLVIKA